MVNGLDQDHRHRRGKTATEDMRRRTGDHLALIELLEVDMTDGNPLMITDRLHHRHQRSDDRTGAMAQRADKAISLRPLARVATLYQMYPVMGLTEETVVEAVALQQAAMCTYRVMTDRAGHVSPMKGNDAALEILETQGKDFQKTGPTEVGPTATGSEIDQATLGTLRRIGGMVGRDPEVQSDATETATIGTMTSIEGVSHRERIHIDQKTHIDQTIHVNQTIHIDRTTPETLVETEETAGHHPGDKAWTATMETRTWMGCVHRHQPMNIQTGMFQVTIEAGKDDLTRSSIHQLGLNPDGELPY
jgi:hypothetical protein